MSTCRSCGCGRVLNDNSEWNGIERFFICDECMKENIKNEDWDFDRYKKDIIFGIRTVVEKGTTK